MSDWKSHVLLDKRGGNRLVTSIDLKLAVLVSNILPCMADCSTICSSGTKLSGPQAAFRIFLSLESLVETSESGPARKMPSTVRPPGPGW